MKKIIYTAIIGNYDCLNTPKIINKDWIYICFTDSPILLNTYRDNVWKIVNVKLFKQLDSIKDKIRLARFIKWSPTFFFNKEIDWSIWVDANIIINVDLNKFILNLPKDNILYLTNHPSRNCIYQEMVAVKSRIKRGMIKENLSGLTKWYENLYFNIGYPINMGLCQTGLKIHNHKYNDKLEILGDKMREIMIKYNINRDQIIFNYLSYKLKLGHYNLKSLASMHNKNKMKDEFYLMPHKELNYNYRLISQRNLFL